MKNPATEFTADANLPPIGRGKRAVVVMQGVPHPSEGASTILFFWYIAALRAAEFDVLNVLLLGEESATDDQKLDSYRSMAATWDRFELLLCRSPKFVVPGIRGIRFDERAFESVAQRIKEFKPDVILSLDITSAAAARRWAGRIKIAWLGDLAFQTWWYHTLYAHKERQIGLKVLLGTALVIWHCWLWRRAYKNILRHYDKIVASSKVQEETLRRIGVNGSLYLPYPWPAMKPRDRDTSRLSSPTLLFIGTLLGLGSRSAFHMLIDDIYPGLIRTYGRGGFRIIVCGRGDLAAWVEQAFQEKSEFEYRGFVDDIEGLMSQCHAMLAPIDVPVGNRSRILTAWSQRLLVIAHRNTALGNPDLIDGVTCYLAASCQEFLDRIRRVTSLPADTKRIAERGYAIYSDKFSPAAAARLLLAEIDDVMSSRQKQSNLT
jgi:glycosyltransferase involved in cell wall biosynthesis